MKLRYYIRGLGIGIIVTALIMGVATKNGIPLTDAEIRVLAQKLGMVESDSLKLSDIQNTTPAPRFTEKPQETPPSARSTAGPQETEAPSQSTAGPQETESPAQSTAEPQKTESPAQPTAEPEAPPSEEPPMETGEKVTIVIRSGATSYSVSIQLAEAGLVENAVAFDTYLCDNGYSRRISTGTYEIEMGTDAEQIAKIITRS